MNKKGITSIGWLIIIAVLGILIAISIPKFVDHYIETKWNKIAEKVEAGQTLTEGELDFYERHQKQFQKPEVQKQIMTGNAELQKKIDDLTAELEKYKNAEKQVQENLALMQKADESVNARDWETFNKVYAENVLVTTPDNPVPTKNRADRFAVVKAFVDAFPDHKIQLPYKAVFGSGDWICAVHENGGTFTEPWHLPNGQILQPTGKKYTMTLVTVGKAKDGELIEEMIIYDMATMMRQLGLMDQ